MTAPIPHHESRPLEKRWFGRSGSLLLYFFLQKTFERLISLFYHYLHLKPREKYFFSIQWVAWSWYNITERSNISCILFPWRAWWSFRHAKLTAGEEVRARTLSRQFSLSSFSLSFFFSFLFFFFLPTFSIFFWRSNAHTYTDKGGRGEGDAKRRGRAERRQRAVHFTRFVDYRLMFDSRLSFSLKYDLIHSPY